MRVKSVLSAGLGALALGLVTASAQAAPVGNLTAAAERGADDSGLVQKVHRYYGYGYHYYHPYYRYHYYQPYYYGYYRPYYYRPYHYYRPHYHYRYHYRHW